MNRNNLISEIEELIEKHRCSVDGFFFDTKGASKEILTHLEKIGLISTPIIRLEKAA